MHLACSLEILRGIEMVVEKGGDYSLFFVSEPVRALCGTLCSSASVAIKGPVAPCPRFLKTEIGASWPIKPYTHTHTHSRSSSLQPSGHVNPRPKLGKHKIIYATLASSKQGWANAIDTLESKPRGDASPQEGYGASWLPPGYLALPKCKSRCGGPSWGFKCFKPHLRAGSRRFTVFGRRPGRIEAQLLKACSQHKHAAAAAAIVAPPPALPTTRHVVN